VILSVLALVFLASFIFFGATGPDAVLRVLLVIAGVGFIIFVHECGHFFTAKWVGAKVHRFYLGFAPKITLGGREITLEFWSYRHGDTVYGVGALLIGGFVEIEGQDVTTAKGKPDELNSKKPWQRALVFAGGAIMNAVFGFLLFMFAFFVGVSFADPQLGAVVPGKPAWEAGVKSGDIVKAVNGKPLSEFGEFGTTIALMRTGEKASVTIERDGKTLDVVMAPMQDEEGRGLTVGVGPIAENKIKEVVPGEPADKAGLKPGDVIKTVRYVNPMTDAPAEFQISNFNQFREAMEPPYLTGRKVSITAERDGRTLEIQIVPKKHAEYGKMWRLGVEPDGYPEMVYGMTVEKVVSAPSPGNAFIKGDRIISINGRAFECFPDIRLAFPEGGELAFKVERSLENGSSIVEFPIPASSAFRWLSKREEVLFAQCGRVAVTRVIPGSPGVEPLNAKGDRLEIGDVILSLGETRISNFDNYAFVMKESKDNRLQITWRRPSTGATFYGFIAAAQGMSDRSYIGVLPEDKRVVVREGPIGALVLGVDRTILWIKRVFIIIRSLAVDRTVSTKYLAGPVGIAHISYKVLDFGFGQLLYVLALISVNLAIVNLLPIPIFDGGHLLFLLIEKLRGKPVSARVQGYMFTGVAILLIAVFVYVTFNDISRFFTGF
jgi:regulator of sigma E protease